MGASCARSPAPSVGDAPGASREVADGSRAGASSVEDTWSGPRALAEAHPESKRRRSLAPSLDLGARTTPVPERFRQER